MSRRVPKRRWSLALPAVCLAALAAAPEARGAAGGAPGPDGIDPCALLADDDMRAVQERAVEERIPSERASASFRVLQCLYRTPDVTGSVSLTLSVPVTGSGAGAGTGPRRYWSERFHGPEAAPSPKEQPPRPVPGLGEEAFWVGDAVAGSLYVLDGGRFLRLSVGGVREEPVRRERAIELAARALARLR